MTRDELQKVAVKWIEELWQKGNAEAVSTLHSNDFIDHSSAGRRNDNEGYKKGIADFYKSFPDFFTVIEDCIVDSEKQEAVIRWNAKGTFKSTYMGFKPSGDEIKFRGIEILKIKNGIITDRWGEWDGVDLMEQLLQSSIRNSVKKNNSEQ